MQSEKRKLRRVRRLTEEWLAACRPVERQEWGDRGHPGLRVRVGPHGAAFYYYTTVHSSQGRATRVKIRLGVWPEATLEQAVKLMQHTKKTGPGGMRHVPKTVRQLVTDFARRRLVHQRRGSDVLSTLRLHALEARPVRGQPAFGEWLAAAVETRHLVDLVEAALTTGQEGSRRWGGPGAAVALAKALRVVFAHAVDSGAVTTNPAAKLDAETVGVERMPRTNWLQDATELRAFFGAVDLRALLRGEAAPSSTTTTGRLALAFLALAPVRTHSFLAAEWSEVDLETGVWTCPPSRLKVPTEAKRAVTPPFLVRLPPTALAILRRLRADAPVGCKWVLPAPGDAGKHLGQQTLVRILHRMQADGRLKLSDGKDGHGEPTKRRLTVHDLRRTWSSWAGRDEVSWSGAERIGAKALAAELCLGHSLSKVLSASAGAYVHSEVAEGDKAALLAAVDAVYRETWDFSPGAVMTLSRATR